MGWVYKGLGFVGFIHVEQDIKSFTDHHYYKSRLKTSTLLIKTIPLL